MDEQHSRQNNDSCVRRPAEGARRRCARRGGALRRAAAAVKTSISAVFRPKAGTPGPGTPDITPVASRRTTDASSFESTSGSSDVSTSSINCSGSNINTGRNSGGDIGRKRTRPLSPTIAALVSK